MQTKPTKKLILHSEQGAQFIAVNATDSAREVLKEFSLCLGWGYTKKNKKY